MTQAPDRIHNWQNTVLSIAAFYGGVKVYGHEYVIEHAAEGRPLVRWDVFTAECRARKSRVCGQMRMEL